MQNPPDLSGFGEIIHRQGEIIHRQMEVFQQQLQIIHRQMEGLQQQIQTAFERYAARLREVDRELPAVQVYLAKRGWYLTGSSSPGDVLRLARLIREDRHAVAEEFMLEYARRRVDSVLSTVSEQWPGRAALLSDAIDAHRNGGYNLSIPVLLAQADGISSQILGASFFAKEKGVPKVSKTYRARLLKEHDPESVNVFFLRPLELLSSLSYGIDYHNSARVADPHLGPLNRHAIIHGYDTDYGTEANGLRAILLLDYLADLRPYFG